METIAKAAVFSGMYLIVEIPRFLLSWAPIKHRALLQVTEISGDGFDFRLGQAVRDRRHDE